MTREIDLNQTSRVDLLKAGMASEIKRIMPKLRTVEPLAGRFNLDQLAERSIRAPAAFPTILKSPFDIRADRTLWMEANCACFFVTEGREEKRDPACWAMAMGFASVLPNNTFGIAKVSAPKKIEVEPLVSAEVRSKGVTIIAITWEQTLKLIGTSLFDDDHVLLEALYLGDEEEPHYVRPSGELEGQL